MNSKKNFTPNMINDMIKNIQNQTNFNHTSPLNNILNLKKYKKYIFILIGLIFMSGFAFGILVGLIF